MTEQQQSPDLDQAEAYATEYDRLWHATVASLTAAVRLRHPQHGAADFGDFLGSAIAAVAANVGSGERITAGRPGSWESAAIEQLITGAVGIEAGPVELADRRTLPVLVPLNVAQLVSEAYDDAPADRRADMLPHLDDAAQVLYKAGEEWSAQHPAPDEGAPAAEWEAYEAAADAQGEQEQDAEDALRRRYAATFEAYAEAFTAAVLDQAHGIEGLSVPVEVKAETDPAATWWDAADTINPADDYDSDDALVWHLWAAARDRVPLPRGLVQIPAVD